jgi:polyisoprenoid-binding protein YceI
VRYKIDTQASKLTAKAFAGGMLSSFGHNPTFAVRKFDGEAEFDANGTGSLDLTIGADSLDLMDDVPKRDRWDIIRVMNEDLLETSRFPEIAYRCPAAKVNAKPTGPGRYDVTLNGDLTLHGVTRSQPVLAHVVIGDGTIRAHGEIMLRQPEYGMKHVTAAGSMIKVKDEVKLAFDIVARKQ